MSHNHSHYFAVSLCSAASATTIRAPTILHSVRHATANMYLMQSRRTVGGRSRTAPSRDSLYWLERAVVSRRNKYLLYGIYTLIWCCRTLRCILKLLNVGPLNEARSGDILDLLWILIFSTLVGDFARCALQSGPIERLRGNAIGWMLGRGECTLPC